MDLEVAHSLDDEERFWAGAYTLRRRIFNLLTLV